MCGNTTKIQWTAILTKIKRMFPNVLLCPHVCKASLNEVCVSSIYSDIYIATIYIASAIYFLAGNFREMAQLFKGKIL